MFDLKKDKKCGAAYLTDPEIYGRIIADMYVFVDGHMYFDNQVFKFRYDNMVEGDIIPEFEFVDKYKHILDLKIGEVVMCKMPKLSLINNKQLYMVSNPKNL